MQGAWESIVVEADLQLLEAYERCCFLCAPLVPSALWSEPFLTLPFTLSPELQEDQLPALLSEPFHVWPPYQSLFPGPYSVSSFPGVPYLVSDSALGLSVFLLLCPARPSGSCSLTTPFTSLLACSLPPEALPLVPTFLLLAFPTMALSPLPGSPPCLGLS